MGVEITVGRGKRILLGKLAELDLKMLLCFSPENVLCLGA